MKSLSLSFSVAFLAMLTCCGSIATAATIAYDPSANDSSGNLRYSGSIGLVFTVSTNLTVTDLGITTNTDVGVNGGAMDSSELWTQIYRLNDPNGDVSDATLLAERNFTPGLAPTVTNIAPWGMNLFFEAPSQPVTLVPGETYVISSYGYGGTPNRAYINGPTNVAIGGEISHLQSRYGTAGTVPTTNNGAQVQYQGPTFRYDVVPESGTVTLGFGALMLAFIRRRRADA